MDQRHPIHDQKHAALMNDFILSMQRDDFRLIGCEIPYNHFGDRGVIDVVLRKDDRMQRKSEWLICELKPELYDIGAAIRQVRKAQEYFQKARPDLHVPQWQNVYRYVLVLDELEKNVQHVEAFHNLFRDVEILYHSSDPEKQRQARQIREIEEAVNAVKAGG